MNPATLEYHDFRYENDLILGVCDASLLSGLWEGRSRAGFLIDGHIPILYRKHFRLTNTPPESSHQKTTYN
jgi:hypothetical protein